MESSLVVAQMPGLRRYARALTGDAWAADDLVQDTLERACGKWRLWTPGTDLRAWLFTLMHNLYLNERRGAHARIVQVPLEDVQDGLIAPAAAIGDMMDLRRALLCLPDEQRAVLLLVTLEDMGYEETAAVLGIPVGTVMSRLSRARARLRELLDGTARAPAPPTPAAAPMLRRMK